MEWNGIEWLAENPEIEGCWYRTLIHSIEREVSGAGTIGYHAHHLPQAHECMGSCAHTDHN